MDKIWVHDARDMHELPDNSVALVVTSPPYFAGKAYEEALGEGSIPADYIEYLKMLARRLRRVRRVLEPGGRMAVNVANLGRKPYRSLSADVIQILPGRPRAAAPGRDHLAEGARRRRQLCAGASSSGPATR